MLNLTVVTLRAAGHLTVYPCSSTRPTTSNVNYAPGTTQANLVVARMDAKGRTCIYTLATHSHRGRRSGLHDGRRSFGGNLPERRQLDHRGRPIGAPDAGSTTELQLTGERQRADQRQHRPAQRHRREPRSRRPPSVYPCGTARAQPLERQLRTGRRTQANLVVARSTAVAAPASTRARPPTSSPTSRATSWPPSPSTPIARTVGSLRQFGVCASGCVRGSGAAGRRSRRMWRRVVSRGRMRSIGF